MTSAAKTLRESAAGLGLSQVCCFEAFEVWKLWGGCAFLRLLHVHDFWRHKDASGLWLAHPTTLELEAIG